MAQVGSSLHGVKKLSSKETTDIRFFPHPNEYYRWGRHISLSLKFPFFSHVVLSAIGNPLYEKDIIIIDTKHAMF